MKNVKKVLIPAVVFLLLISSIILNILEVNNPRTSIFQSTTTPPAEKILTKTSALNEKLTLPLNDTTIEMKINRTETSVVPVKDALTGAISNQIYFQVFATVKNLGTKSFSFSSTPVIGVSKNNYILMAKNIINNDENKIIVGTDAISQNQNANLMNSSLEIKPGNESSGFFLFENEVQTVQVLSSSTPYIWQTMKIGSDILGKESSLHDEISNAEGTIKFKIIDTHVDSFDNKQLNILRISMTNTGNSEIAPLSFIPKYGTSIPGEVYKSEVIDESLKHKYTGQILNANSKLGANQTEVYLIAFPKNVSFIFVQPPMVENSINIRIIL